VKVYKGATYYIPNAFTPNGDGINDIFKAVAPGIKQTDYFKIYNRWGKLMFESKNTKIGWDGKYSGMPQPAAVYVWMIKGTDVTGKLIQLKGIVTLIR
jgi:gliding motility-associated-like protein